MKFFNPKNLHTILVITCFAIILIGFIEFIYLKTDGIYFNRPIIFTNGTEFTTTKNVYKRGDTVEATISFCKERVAQSTFQWQLVDSYLRFFPAKTSSLAVGCYHNFGFEIETLPEDLLSETYYFTGSLTYHINNMNTITIPISTNKFIIK